MPLQAVSIILIQAFPDMPADDPDQIENQVVVFRAREQVVAEVVAHERLLAQREQPHHRTRAVRIRELRETPRRERT